MKIEISPAFIEPHYSTKLWRAYRIYLDQYYGEALLDEICAEIGIPKAYLVGESNWVSEEFARLFIEKLIQKTGDAKIARKVGRFALTAEVLTEFEYALIKPLPAYLFFRKIEANSAKLNCFHSFKILHSSPGFFNFMMSPKGAENCCHDVYENTAGIFEAVEELYDLAQVTVKYDLCIDGRGIESAHFQIRYAPQFHFGIMSKIAYIFPVILIGLLLRGQIVGALKANDSALNLLIAILIAICSALFLFARSFHRTFNSNREYHRHIRKISQDIYEAKLSTEMKGRELERRAEIFELAETMAHDIRSPLSALRLVILSSMELSEEKRNLVSQASRRIESIARDFLISVRATQALGEKSSSDLNRVTRKLDSGVSVHTTQLGPALEELVNEKRIEYQDRLKSMGAFELVQTAETHQLRIGMDKSRLQRVLSNIINNSFEAISGGGYVRIFSRQINDSVEIEIRDNGVGIPEHVLKDVGRQRIVSCDDRTRVSAGIGLMSAAEAMKKIGGQLRVESKVGEGTSVSLVLPVIDVKSHKRS